MQPNGTIFLSLYWSATESVLPKNRTGPARGNYIESGCQLELGQNCVIQAD